MESHKFLNALNLISGVGAQKIKKLLAYFENPKNIWEADLSSLKKSQIPENLAEKIFTEKSAIDPDKEWGRLSKEKINLITLTDENYPALLKEIHNPPYILYAKGFYDFSLPAPIISIVGSRKFSPYGEQVAFGFAKNLAESGITVVSGMAMGIDTFAHKGALLGKGKTIAILGNGLDEKNIYPRANLNLSRQITQNGMLLSEYPLGTPAGPLTFPARNRLVAGLSLGTLVVEAGEKSGALITAQMALDANREVFSVPGSIFSASSLGTNELIKKGARAVSSVKDVLEELDLIGEPVSKNSTPKNPSNVKERTILEILNLEPIHIDILSKLTKLNTAELSSALSIMEIKGWVKNIGGQNYINL
jgi:DNA processing protein